MLGNYLRAGLITVVALAGFTAAAQAGASKLDGPLTLVVGYAPGGASDQAARIVAHGLEQRLGVSVVVENKTGAGGRIAADYVKNAAADKNILMLGNPAVMVIAPLVFKALKYDPVKDFRPVSMVTQYGFGVAVPGDSPIKDLQGLVQWAKAHPKEFNVGVPATGSLPHFFGLMLAEKIGVHAEIIGYRGSAPLMTDLIGKTVPVAIDTLDVMIKQHEAGKIRILATSGADRENKLPDVPTFTQAGVKLVASGWNAFFAPASMPQDKAGMLGQAIMQTVSDPAITRQLEQSDLIPVEADASKTEALVLAFRTQWEPVVKDSGFKVER